MICLSLNSLSSTAYVTLTTDSLPSDSITFSRETAEQLTFALLERDALRETISVKDSIIQKQKEILDVRAFKIEALEEVDQFREDQLLQLQTSDRACQIQVESWQKIAATEKKRGRRTAVGGILLGAVIAIFAR